ncbi:hypothetical protein NDS46_28670 [Paenibacillus thiaminolyticus]|uniref:hypothetical protein n=1 Tax=Paenibacillus thiaminolyticus TaxID=49283 RepID=UPI00232D584D|nr:hypothetical protein [Paenibacillus thiaminolyticus]WCF08183.1 hypothetical protein NDS46_28670 [Paenibacillus thiaminolyticus]
MNSTIAIRLAIIIIACYSIVTIVDFIEKDRYEEITESQLRDIVAAEEITVLAEERLNNREKPVEVIGAHGGFSYVKLKVNENRIREHMSRIVVAFDDKGEITTEASPDRSSYIIVYDPPEEGRVPNRSSDIRIYDSEGELLFHSD